MAPSPKTPKGFALQAQTQRIAFCLLLARGAISSAAKLVDRATLMKFIPPTMSRDASSMPAATSSFTALALAPGRIENDDAFAQYNDRRGMLFTPAPARAIALTDSGNIIWR